MTLQGKYHVSLKCFVEILSVLLSNITLQHKRLILDFFRNAYYLCFLKYKQSLLYHFRLINHSLVCRKNHERHCIKVTVIIIQIDVAHKSSLETCFLEKFYRLECYSLIDLEFNSIFSRRTCP